MGPRQSVRRSGGGGGGGGNLLISFSNPTGYNCREDNVDKPVPTPLVHINQNFNQPRHTPDGCHVGKRRCALIKNPPKPRVWCFDKSEHTVVSFLAACRHPLFSLSSVPTIFLTFLLLKTGGGKIATQVPFR